MANPNLTLLKALCDVEMKGDGFGSAVGVVMVFHLIMALPLCCGWFVFLDTHPRDRECDLYINIYIFHFDEFIIVETADKGKAIEREIALDPDEHISTIYIISCWLTIVQRARARVSHRSPIDATQVVII